MVKDPDVQRVIDKIDLRIQSLQHARQVLAHEFAGGEVQGVAPATIPPPEESREVKGNTIGRKESIISFLKQNGPSTRSEIIRSLAIPKGTVGFYLTKKDLFMHMDDGRWMITPEM